LEPVVDEKYFLSNKMLAQYITFEETGNEISVKGEVTPNSQCGKVYGSEGLFPTIIAGTHGYAMGYIEEPVCAAMRGRYEGDQINQHLEQRTDGITNTLTSVQKDNLIIVKEATKKGYAIANEGDSINLSNINSETRRGRVVVGVGVANTLDTSCNQAVVVGETINNRIAGWHENENVVGAHRNDKKRSSVSEHIYHKEEGICTTIQAAHIPKLYGKRIRRLTERECLRLQGFSDSFITPCSGTQTYKQSGNSIPVTVLKAIILNIQKALNGKI
jgi:DNA (cytosine-5)-methyltransferase 1